MRNKAVSSYQYWYSVALSLLKEYMPERESEFVKYYANELDALNKSGAKDCLSIDYVHYIGKSFLGEKEAIDLRTFEDNIDEDLETLEELQARYITKLKTPFFRAFYYQCCILWTLPKVAELKEVRLRKLISVEFAKSEIEEAEKLYESGFPRAAGAIAGVALEKHLKMLCDTNEIIYKPDSTINPIAQLLRGNGQLDDIQIKRITYLASIRNKCSHGNEVSEEDIKSLIDEVKKLVT